MKNAQNAYGSGTISAMRTGAGMQNVRRRNLMEMLNTWQGCKYGREGKAENVEMEK